MKKIRTVAAAFAIISTCFFVSFKKAPAPSIKGKVSPGWYAVNAWAISGSDTLYTSVTDGSFQFAKPRPGTYRIIIEARSPYRHMAKDGVVVKDGEETDIELSLQKY
jgi:hypothetical protein